MNAKQLKLLQVGTAVAVLMGMFPPWTKTFHYEQVHSEGPAGYALIIEPPKADMLYTVKIDLSRLFVQWIVVAMAVGGGLLYFRQSGER